MQCSDKSIHDCAIAKISLVSNQPVCSTKWVTILQENADIKTSVQAKLRNAAMCFYTSAFLEVYKNNSL